MSDRCDSYTVHCTECTEIQISYPFIQLIKDELNHNIVFKSKELCNSTSNPRLYCVQVHLGHIDLHSATASKVL